jgi:acyl dehydratase
MPEEKMRYYDDFEVGEVTVYPGRYTLTEENILAVGKEWDPYPFHTDPEAAKDTFYGGLVASTVHLFAISVKLNHTSLEVPAAISSLGTTDMINHAPAYAGDTIENHCKVIAKRLSKSKPGIGILTAQSQLINQEGKLLFSYVNSALYKLRAAED